MRRFTLAHALRIACGIFLVGMCARVVFGAPSFAVGLLRLGITLACAAGFAALLLSFWLVPSVRRNRALRGKEGVRIVRTGLRRVATEEALSRIRPELNVSAEERVLESATFSVVFVTEGLSLIDGRREYRLVCLLTWTEIVGARVGVIEERGRRQRSVTIQLHDGKELPVMIGREYLGGAFPCSRADADTICDLITTRSISTPTVAG